MSKITEDPRFAGFKPFESKAWLSSPTMHGDEQKWVDDAITTNCYNMGMVVNGESFARGNNIQITNCFDPVTNWPALPASPIEDFTNGTVYAALSEAAPGIWFLSAAIDGHPVLYNTGITTSVADVERSTLNIERVYDLQGRRVNGQRSIVYGQLLIVNGRKVIK